MIDALLHGPALDRTATSPTGRAELKFQISKSSKQTHGLLCAVAMLKAEGGGGRVCAQAASSPVLVVSAKTGAKKAAAPCAAAVPPVAAPPAAAPPAAALPVDLVVQQARALPGFADMPPDAQDHLIDTLYSISLSPEGSEKYSADFKEMAGPVVGGGARAAGGGSGGSASPRDSGGGGSSSSSGAGGLVVTAAQIQRRYGVTDDHAAAMLKEADRNGDGVLSKLEFLAFCARVGPPLSFTRNTALN